MLFLLLKLGDDRYALDAKRILEVLPLVDIKRIPQAATGVAGLIDYRGAPVPVIDLSALALGRAFQKRMSTRIAMVEFADNGGGTNVVGLIAEGATETLRLSAAGFSEFGLAKGTAPYLGPVTRDARGLIQRIDVEHLLPQALRETLFVPRVVAG